MLVTSSEQEEQSLVIGCCTAVQHHEQISVNYKTKMNGKGIN